MNIHFELLGVQGFLTDLDRIDQGVSKLRPLWELFGKEFHAQEEAHFDKADFAPLSPAYAEIKRRQFGDKPILRATDALFDSLTQQNAAGSIYRVEDLDAEFGTSDFKAMFHQEGTSRMPARPPLAEPDEERYESLAMQYLNDLIN